MCTKLFPQHKCLLVYENLWMKYYWTDCEYGGIVGQEDRRRLTFTIISEIEKKKDFCKFEYEMVDGLMVDATTQKNIISFIFWDII